MNKFDTIINVLQKVGLLFESHGQYPHTLREVNEALTAAKELRDALIVQRLCKAVENTKSDHY